MYFLFENHEAMGNFSYFPKNNMGNFVLLYQMLPVVGKVDVETCIFANMNHLSLESLFSGIPMIKGRVDCRISL